MKSIIKKSLILGFSLALLSGCENDVEFKNDEDRASFTKSEIETVENMVKEMKGVTSFDINYIEGGVYAVLEVEDRKYAKDLAIEAFNAMWAETTGIVDLFVQEKGKEDVLIQAFKPAGTDKENNWDILL